MGNENERNPNEDRRNQTSQGGQQGGNPSQQQTSGQGQQGGNPSQQQQPSSQGGGQGDTKLAGTQSTGTDSKKPQDESKEGGFVGSEKKDSGEYLQKDQPGQANKGGFPEQGRGAEKDGERGENRQSDTEGSSDRSR